MADLEDRMSEVAAELLSNAKEAVEERGHCTTTVVGFPSNDLNPQYFFPRWEDEEEKNVLFAQIRKELKNMDAEAAITVAYSDWKPSDAPEGTTHPAVTMIRRTREEANMVVFPFTRSKGTTYWLSPVHQEVTDGGFVRYPPTED